MADRTEGAAPLVFGVDSHFQGFQGQVGTQLADGGLPSNVLSRMHVGDECDMRLPEDGMHVEGDASRTVGERRPPTVH